MNITANSSRTDLEGTILENDILAWDTAEELAAIGNMSNAELYKAIVEWIIAGDECDQSCR